jgi:hypothetical protein
LLEISKTHIPLCLEGPVIVKQWQKNGYFGLFGIRKTMAEKNEFLRAIFGDSPRA